MILCDFEEGGLGQIKVVTWRIAPAATIVVGRAEVGGSDNDGGREAPFGIVVAAQLVAGAAAQAVVEESSA